MISTTTQTSPWNGGKAPVVTLVSDPRPVQAWPAFDLSIVWRMGVRVDTRGVSDAVKRCVHLVLCTYG